MIALVTGGLKNLGKEISRFLIDQKYHVVTISRNIPNDEEIQTWVREKKITPFLMDLSEIHSHSAKHIFTQIETEFNNPIQVFIHNASVFTPSSIELTDLEQLDSMMSVHLKSFISISQDFIKQELLPETGSKIIAITDTGADLLWTQFAYYCISKHSLHHAVKLLAKTVSPRISVNAIAPGVMNPLEMEKLSDSIAYQRILPNPDQIEIIRLIHFLLNSNFTTGSIFTVDGGRSLF